MGNTSSMSHPAKLLYRRSIYYLLTTNLLQPLMERKQSAPAAALRPLRPLRPLRRRGRPIIVILSAAQRSRRISLKSLPSLVRNHLNGLKGLVGLNALITSSRLTPLVAARIIRRGSHHSSRLAATTQLLSNYSQTTLKLSSAHRVMLSGAQSKHLWLLPRPFRFFDFTSFRSE